MYTNDLTAQALSFCPVLPPQEQPQALDFDGDGKPWLHIRADGARSVALRVYGKEYPFTKGADGLWHMEYPLRDGYTYVQLLLDGAEVLTPYLPINYGYSRPYNCVILDEQDDFYRLKEVPHGVVRREYYLSSVTGEWESCLIYTPPGYEEDPERTYPVLYLQHGHGENEVGWVNAGKLNFILDNLVAAKEAVPFVVVMNNGMVQTVTEEGRRVVDHTLFSNLLIKDVIPFVEQKYRIKGERTSRAMAGLSMGSMQTSAITFTHPELFAYVGLFSGFLRDFIQGGEMDMLKREPSANAHLRALDDAKKFEENFRVFFRGIGEKDEFFPLFEEDDAILQKKRIPCTRKVYKGAHEWNVWRKCIRDFACMLFQEKND